MFYFQTGALAACTVSLLGCAGLLGQGGNYSSMTADDRSALEEACTAYVERKPRSREKKAACSRLAQLNSDELMAAKQSGDFSLIGKICSGEERRDENADGRTFTREGSMANTSYALKSPPPEIEQALVGVGNARFSAKHVACNFERANVAGNTGAQMEEMLAKCGDGAEIFKAFNSLPFEGKTARTSKLREVAIAVGKCGKWDDVFVHAMHQDKLMAGELSRAGHDVEKLFVAFLERHQDAPLDFEHSTYVIDTMVAWMVANKRFGQCSTFQSHYKRMSSAVQSGVVIYFAKAGCKAAAPLIAPNLAHEKASYRAQACGALGMLGAQTQLKKIKMLAASDPTYRVDGLHRVYWVRDECTKAANKISMR